MPVVSNQPPADTKQKDPHLALLTPLNPPWVAIKPGNWMGYGPTDSEGKLTPMLLVSIKPGKYGVEMEFACCPNPKCTNRLKLAGKWNGKHYEMGTEKEVKPE